MEEKNSDRRTARTRKAIIDAFIALLTEKELNKVTVQEIADRADINRATFYKHYLDVYDLYEKIEQKSLSIGACSFSSWKNWIRMSFSVSLWIIYMKSATYLP